MTLQSKITAAKPTLADLARDILADRWDRMPEGDYSDVDGFEAAAQTYLDNLADGYDLPDELIDLIAEGIAAEEYGSAHYLFSLRKGGADFTPFSDWMDRGDYRLRAAESYVPAGGVL